MTHPLPAPPRADWEMEAKRVACAFNVDVSVCHSQGAMREYQGFDSESVRISWTICATDAKAYWFIVGSLGESCMVWYDDECIPGDWLCDDPPIFYPTMARGLWLLWQTPPEDMPEPEKWLKENLGFEPTAHERLEWMLDFKKRMEETL